MPKIEGPYRPLRPFSPLPLKFVDGLIFPTIILGPESDGKSQKFLESLDIQEYLRKEEELALEENFYDADAEIFPENHHFLGYIIEEEERKQEQDKIRESKNKKRADNKFLRWLKKTDEGTKLRETRKENRKYKKRRKDQENLNKLNYD